MQLKVTVYKFFAPAVLDVHKGSRTVFNWPNAIVWLNRCKIALRSSSIINVAKRIYHNKVCHQTRCNFNATQLEPHYKAKKSSRVCLLTAVTSADAAFTVKTSAFGAERIRDASLFTFYSCSGETRAFALTCAQRRRPTRMELPS